MADVLAFIRPNAPAAPADEFTKALQAATILLDYTPRQVLAILDSWVEDELISARNSHALKVFLGFIK